MEREKLIEVFIGLIFVVLLIMIVVVVFSVTGSAKVSSTNSGYETQKQTVVNNYYNEHNYNYESPEKPTTRNVVYKYDNDEYVVYKRNDRDFDGYGDGNHYDHDDFSSYGNHEKKKGLSNYVDEYSVFVKNEDNVGKYFKVAFYFWDSSDIDDTESINRWVGPGKTEKFVYRDVHLERNNYEKWSYDIFSQDDGFDEELHESNSGATRFHSVPSISCR